MAYSSILGADPAPELPEGRDAGALGPSDNSDSGSDTIGTHEAHADSDSRGTGERGGVDDSEAPEGADILPDRVVDLDEAAVSLADDEADLSLEDLDGRSAEEAAAADLDGDDGDAAA